MKRIDIVGEKYGHLTVKEMLYNYNGNNKTYCLCDCDCENHDIVKNAFKLRNYSSEFTSCGCANKEKAAHFFGRDINGQRFGRLMVLETLWCKNPPKVRCQCDCGTIGIFRKNDVQRGHTQSCGCATKESTSRISTKDWAGYVSESGVQMVRPLYQNIKRLWIWECICPLCGQPFEALPIKIFNNHTTSCGCKRVSSGERIIENILQNIGVDYQQEYSYEDCKSKYKLRFDFAVMKNNEVLFLIEYDGQQHFLPVGIFGGEQQYKETLERDHIKNDYCKSNNIPLLRLNYKQTVDEYRQKINEYIKSVTTTGGTW